MDGGKFTSGNGFFFSIKFLYVYIHLSLIDSFTEVSRFRCLTRLDDLLKQINNENWLVCFEKQGKNKTTKS